MIVIVDEPRRYYCHDDEDHFFKWHGLPAFQGVRRTSAGLEISFSDPIDRDSMYRLIGLLKRYSVDAKPLKGLCHPGIEEWLRDDRMYWHAEMFGDEVADK